MTTVSPAQPYLSSEGRTERSLLPIHAAERLGATLALLALAPFLVFIAVVIAILSRRSPLVRHARAGWRGAPLRMLKFRTMWCDADRPAPLFTIEEVTGWVPGSKSAYDSRVSSPFAAFCRRYSLDELPQLYHVARGEMSLVGPRPVTPGELQCHYGDCVEEVLSLRPGLTGLWQIRGRNRLSYARRRRLDLLFVRRFSAGLYLRILLQSIPRALSGDGAF
jgi:exopolysaccharide production protein ExoY